MAISYNTVPPNRARQMSRLQTLLNLVRASFTLALKRNAMQCNRILVKGIVNDLISYCGNVGHVDAHSEHVGKQNNVEH